MATRRDKARIAILKALSDAGAPMGASRIASALLAMGIELHPRTVRLHLLHLDEGGLTKLVTRRSGRVITQRGLRELGRANVIEKVGIIAARVDALAYKMTFHVSEGSGTIIVNVSIIGQGDLDAALAEMRSVFSRGLAMGTKLVIVPGGGTLGGIEVPKDGVGIGTVCSVTVNGILQHEGIPVVSRFGGLLEMRGRRPTRFVDLIEYRGTTLDPLEAFIKADMTRVRECARRGAGIVGASFREVPSAAIDDVRRIGKEMEAHGLAGILEIGAPNQALLDIPVAEGRAGMIVIAGLNPIAALHEAGIAVTLHSLAGLEAFESLAESETAVCR